MPVYRIAGICVSMEPKYETLIKQGKAYLLEDGAKADFAIRLSEEFLTAKQQAYPHLSRNDCEYIWHGSAFYNQILDFGGLFLHASAIAYEGKAYLFSAPSGTGKSTHTALWKKQFGSGAEIINDDKPALKLEDGTFFVYGTPFSGKTDQNRNMRVPLQAIGILSRSAKNRAERMDAKDALLPILNQTIRPSSPERMDTLLKLLDVLLSNVPVYSVACNMESEAATVAYHAMKREVTI